MNVASSLHPTPGAVIVKRKPAEEGLIAIGHNPSEAERGVVVAVGEGAIAKDGRTRTEPSVSVGDRVGWLFKTGTSSFVHRGEELVFVADRDLKFLETVQGLRPLHDYVIFQLAEKNMRPWGEKGRIYAPDTSKETQSIGRVVSVGPGRFCEDGITRYPMSVKVGDRFRFFGSAPSFIFKGERYWVVKDEVIAFTEDPEGQASTEDRPS